MIKVREIAEIEGYWAFQSYAKLLYGLKMLPAYASEPWESFFQRTGALPFEQKEILIREALLYVDLTPQEIFNLMSFASDANGVKYGPHNIKGKTPREIYEIQLAVVLEIAKMPTDFVTESEKKNLKTSA